MNVDYARQRLVTKLAQVQEVSPGVLRGVRRSGEKNIAVYLFDLNDKVTDSANRLEAYQDEIVGKSYFDTDADADLRWNHYLYLVSGAQGRQDSHLLEARRKVESDHSYARKFVIDEADFDMVVERIDSIVVADSKNVGDVVEVWSTKLIEAGLGCILEHDKTIADTVRIIATGKSKNTTRQRRISGVNDSERLSANWIRDIDLSGFRQYPIRNKFQQLGQANLLFGTNGVGKTSLLEAIEFLYCGTNRRSGPAGSLMVSANLADGTEINTSSLQKLSDFDTRLQNWYGSANKSTSNKLAQAFARFNFLNTDAASELALAKDGDGVKSNINSLADLVSGPGTAVLWARIRDVEKELVEHKKRLTVERRLRETEMKAAQQELQMLNALPGQSDAEFEILKSELDRLAWRAIPSERKSVTAKFVAELAEFAARLGSVRRLSWTDNAVTLTWLKETYATLTTCKSDASKAQDDSAASRRRQLGYIERHKTLEEQQRALISLDLSTVEKMLQTKESLLAVERQLAGAAPLFAVLGDDTEYELANELMSAPVAHAATEVVADLRKVTAKISSVRAERDRIHGKNSLLAEMGAQIRQLAQKMLSHGHTGEHCPVCSTPFATNELAERIHRSVVTEGETEVAALSQLLDALVQEEKRLQQVGGLLAKVTSYCEAGNIGNSSLEVQAVLKKMRETRALWIAQSTEKATLIGAMTSFEKAGLSEARIKNLCTAVGDEFGHSTLTTDLCSAALAHVSAELDAVSKSIAQGVTESLSDTPIDVAMFARRVGLSGIGMTSLAEVIEEVSLRIEAVSATKGAVDWAASKLELRAETDFRALHSSVSDAVLTAESTVKAAEREVSSGHKIDGLKLTVSQKQDKAQQLTKSLDSVTEALATLADLVKHSSIGQASQTAISATHKVANDVFARIHAPNEFEITTNATMPLNRKQEGRGVSLNEISTGQRAAYALSVFLAMNAQVQAGPKVILLDDPISHIDDLNALSFLDYLRNLIIKERRQVFFATADEKIAGLFAHKFAFLGQELRTIELGR